VTERAFVFEFEKLDELGPRHQRACWISFARATSNCFDLLRHVRDFREFRGGLSQVHNSEPTRIKNAYCENEKDIIPSIQGRTIGEIASLLGVGRASFYRVMSGGSAITPDMTVRLGKLCGNGPELWLNMQARFDAWEASRRLAESRRFRI
jgi:addiction module HigA family antidote